MHEPAIRNLLARCGERALQTMFFAMPDSISGETQRPPGPLVAASLTFKGSSPGSFGTILSEPLGRAMAASFLGADDEERVSPAQIGEVCGELTNIACGSVLTALEADGDF